MEESQALEKDLSLQRLTACIHNPTNFLASSISSTSTWQPCLHGHCGRLLHDFDAGPARLYLPEEKVMFSCRGVFRELRDSKAMTLSTA